MKSKELFKQTKLGKSVLDRVHPGIGKFFKEEKTDVVHPHRRKGRAVKSG